MLNRAETEMNGFTLIELIIVVVILATLLAIVITAINPQRQYQQAGDTKRQADITAILDAVTQYRTEHSGSSPSGITGTLQNISSSGSNICSSLVPTYISKLPVDPSINNGNPIINPCPATYTTGYSIRVDSPSGRVTVTAPYASGGTITVTR